MTKIERFAPAKINLTLHVTGQRADGFHLLDSLVMFADVGDVIRVSASQNTRLTIDGPMANNLPLGPQNLVHKAARFFGISAEIHLEKHLPVAAGIGGGSSDAAATLLALSQLTGLPIPPGSGRALGADVPVCLVQSAVRMSGIGDDLEPLESIPELFGVLVNPMVNVSTPEVFKALQNKNNAAMRGPIPKGATLDGFMMWLASHRNDLEGPAARSQPLICDVLTALSCLDDVRLVRMSGSGASCFGLFASFEKARNNATILADNHPNWWVRAVRLN